jgi:hypothetical protein
MLHEAVSSGKKLFLERTLDMQRVSERKDDMTISREFSLTGEDSLPTFTWQYILSLKAPLAEVETTPSGEERSVSLPFLKENREKKD